MPDPSTIKVLVTGAGGNLGRKLVDHLAAMPWCSAVTAADVVAASPAHPKVQSLALDLTRPSGALDGVAEEADAAVHLAARSPHPDASWDDGAASFDMTLNLAEALARSGAGKRLVFASSNHVMGGYKEEDVAPGSLTTLLPPRPGTRTGPGDVPRAYAAAKLMGERLLAAKGRFGGLTTVSLRIGWCQPGPNRPDTISAAGVAGKPLSGGGEAARELAWFRAMWLSNRDFLAACSAAIRADAAGWPAPAIVVNAMSDNAGMPWDLGPTRRLLGYAPQDDAARELGAARP